MLASAAAVVPSHALAASLRAHVHVRSARHAAPVLLDDEAMEAGLRARAERRAALLKQTRENLQTHVSFYADFSTHGITREKSID